MIGYNDGEGISFHLMYSDPSDFIPGDLNIEENSDEAIELMEEILDFYFDGGVPSVDSWQGLIQLFTDLWFGYQAHRCVQEHLKTTNNPIYFYRFSADTRLNVYKLRTELTASFPGATHADELGYLFLTYYHAIIPDIAPDSLEDKAIDRIVKLWTNFAKYGNPTPEGFTEFQWSPVTSETFNYVDFGSSETIPGVDPDAENIKFWSDIYAKYSSSNIYGGKPLLLIFCVCVILIEVML